MNQKGIESRGRLRGSFEIRYISKLKVNSTILKKFLSKKVNQYLKVSFSLMMITTDLKVVLLQRTTSFYFSKVIKDLKLNKINLLMLESLYTTELKKIKKLFFDFMDDDSITFGKDEKKVYIFPGGHSNKTETILATLLRELREELGMEINPERLRFNQSCVFNVLIHDMMVHEYFNNFIFPVKVDLTSTDIKLQFKDTKHTSNLTFIDVSTCTSLVDAFLKVQRFMLL